MTPQRDLFKWLAMAVILAALLGFALVSPSASAQEETPPDSTETPTEIPPEETYFPTMMPTPTAEPEEPPLPFGVQGANEPAPLSTGWSTPLNISVTDSNSTEPGIAVDSSGGIHVVWTEIDNGGITEIYYKYRDGTGSWSTPINVSNSNAFDSDDAQVTVDNSGTAHIVWTEEDDDYAWDAEIFYSRCTGEECTAPVNLSGPQNWDCGRFLPNLQDWHSEIPVIGIDQAGRLMAAWRAYEPGENTMPYSTWLNTGTPPSVRSGCVPSGAGVLNRSVGSSRIMGGLPGDFRLIFEELRSGGALGIYYSDYSFAQWTTSFLGQGQSPDVFLDADNQAHATWCGSDGKLQYWRNFSTEPILDVSCNSRSPIAVDADGHPRVFWNQAGQIYESTRLPEGWSEGINIFQGTGGAASPDVAVDGNGYLHLVWYDARHGNYEVYYATTAPSSCVTDAFEPDNSPSTGSTLSSLEDQRHSLCPQNDEDWAKVTTNGPSQPNLLVETFDLEPDSIHPNGDTQLTVLDESENQIGTNQFRGLGPFPGSTDILRSSRVVWHPAAGGVFNIKVFPETQINERAGSGYSLRLANPFTDVDPVDQASWGPTRVNVPLIWRSGNVVYFTQYFTYEQAELDALINLNASLAWEFRRPAVNSQTGEEEKDSNVDFGDYLRNVDGVCIGDYWTNLPNHTDKYSEEENSLGCSNEEAALRDEEFELYVDDPTELVADKPYYITIKFYVHNDNLNNNYQFYITKVEYCELTPIFNFAYLCNASDEWKGFGNLIEGCLHPAP